MSSWKKREHLISFMNKVVFWLFYKTTFAGFQ